MQSNHPPSRLGGYRLSFPIETTQNSFVYLAYSPKNSEKVILKVIPHSLTTPEAMESERQIQCMMNHPYIMPLRSTFDEAGFRVMCMQRALAGSLASITSNSKFSPRSAQILMYRLLEAVHYMHTCKRVLHGDIKPENIVCVNKDIEDVLHGDPIPMIIDFGHACILSETPFCNCRKMTCIYSSPEVLSLKDHSFPSDIWSLGATFYFIIAKKAPLRLTYLEKMAKSARNIKLDEEEGGLWDDLPKSMKSLIGGMLLGDQEKRLTAQQCLEHPSFREGLGYSWIEEEEQRIKNYMVSH